MSSRSSQSRTSSKRRYSHYKNKPRAEHKSSSGGSSSNKPHDVGHGNSFKFDKREIIDRHKRGVCANCGGSGHGHSQCPIKLGQQYKQTSKNRPSSSNKVSFGKGRVNTIRHDEDSSSQWDDIDPEEKFYNEFKNNCKAAQSRHIDPPLSDSDVDLHD